MLNVVTGERPPLVNQAFEDISAMLKTGGQMLAAATGHLLDNEILEVDLEELDNSINRGEINLRRVILEHLSINPKKDLVFSLKLLSIVQEAERIGDLAKSMAELATLAAGPRMGFHVDELRNQRDDVIRMLNRTHAAFVNDDEEEARRLMREQEALKARLLGYLRQLCRDQTLATNEAIVLAMTSRMLSRVGSHLANIASTVASPFDHIRGTTEA